MKMLKIGANGKVVEELQKLLKKKKYLKWADGDFGPVTQSAVKAFQKDNNLFVDGVVGKRTWEELRGNHVEPWQLTEQDVVRAAKELGVELAAIKAVAEVESRGGGFFKAGQPKVLFERHWMNRRLKSHGLTLAAELGRSQRPDLVNSSRGGYRGGAHEWTRLQTARKLSDASAIESASYGRFQIMGFHWEALGYASPQAWLEAMCKNEGHQLDAFVQFIKVDPRLHDALKKKRWATFAEIYNGPAYAENEYDVKMAEAYERHKAE